jgi:hypothetical protein
MKKLNTDLLMHRLLNTNSIDRFLTRHDENIQLPEFGEYISELCALRGTLPERIIAKAQIKRTYGHKLFNGERAPSRDKVLQLAFGFEMNTNEAQNLLKMARKSPLHPKVRRDAVVVYALEKEMPMDAVQTLLFEMGLPMLGGERMYD